MIRPVPNIARMAAYALATPGAPGALHLDQNESAFPPSPRAIESGRAALAEAHLYPDPSWHALRTAIAEVHALDPARILCGAGSMELIGCLIRAYAGAGHHVLVSQYGYAFARTAAQQAGAAVITASERNLALSVDDLLEAVQRTTKIVFVCNPGNPTGTLIADSEILRLRASLASDILLIVDQAYGEFSDQHAKTDPASVFALVDRGDTVVTRTFSKAYGLASARVGWGYFPENIAAEMLKLLNPNNIPASSQAAATAAMRDQAHMLDVVAKTAALRSAFLAEAWGLGISAPQSHTNFVLLDFASPETCERVDKALRDKNILMRGMASYGLPGALRATIGSAKVMRRAIDAMKGALS